MTTTKLSVFKSIMLLILLILSFFYYIDLKVNAQDLKMKLIYGQVLDKGGRPASQYPVRIEGIGSLSGTELFAVTDFSGMFQLYNVLPGEYRIYPINQSQSLWKNIIVKGEEKEKIEPLILEVLLSIKLNLEAAKTINPWAAKTINPEAAKTINPEAAKTINPEAAKTINPWAAKTINPEAAKTINPEAAKTINPEAARTINPEAARLLNADRARILTGEMAKTISPIEASKPLKY